MTPEQPAPPPSRSAEETSRADDPASVEPLTIVGIGGSAGGLRALRELLGQMPRDCGVAFVVVVHLSPDQKSHLADLLQPSCAMPVRQVTETVPIEPNSVYIIPPNANLNTIDTHLRLSEVEQRRAEQAPIDHFFRTLAETHDGHAIGIILTGTGSDGTLGLRWVKERGGVTIAQSPDEAEYDGMPRNAIASGFVDLVLPLDQMADRILRIARTRPKPSGLEHLDEPADDNNRLLRQILAQLRATTGQDFSHYKPSTIARRIARRMQLHQLESMSAYLALLRSEREEAHHLFGDLLITVTEFFRDPEIYDQLEKEVVPSLFEGKSRDDTIRVWSIGCSTGEEAYSLAIVLLEEAGRRGVDYPRIQVFASDRHAHSLKAAREGVYPDSIAANVTPERLRRWFLSQDGHYRVRSEVRDLVLFTPHDLLQDPPFSHLGLVVCRNVLIYLQRDMQHEVMGLFHYALNPDGLLLLGPAETVEASDLFAMEDKDSRLYRRRPATTRDRRFPVFPLAGSVPRPIEGARVEPRASAQKRGYGQQHARAIERHAPPSILVDESHDVVHVSANAGKYLELPGGEATRNVFKLVPKPFRAELRGALHAAAEQNRAVRSKPIRATLAGEQRRIVLRVRIPDEPDLRGLALVMFDEADSPPALREDGGDSAGATAAEFEAELDLTRKRMQGVVDQYETSQEEMRASNEELQSANEELRSTLEELETSREELQSMNEELTTVNQENRHRVEQLAQLSSDLSNLLGATHIPTLFLDRNLQIVRFTPQVGELFNIRVADRGRPLSDFAHRLGESSMPEDARRVLERLTPVEREIQCEDGRWFLTRVMPYRTADDRIDGVVITLVDITERKDTEERLRSAKQFAENIVATLHEPLLVLSEHLVVKAANAPRSIAPSPSPNMRRSGAGSSSSAAGSGTPSPCAGFWARSCRPRGRSATSRSSTTSRISAGGSCSSTGARSRAPSSSSWAYATSPTACRSSASSSRPETTWRSASPSAPPS